MGRETPQLLSQNISFFCENGKRYFESQPQGLGPGNHHCGRVPSLDTDLTWTPEDVEEAGDDLVGVTMM